MANAGKVASYLKLILEELRIIMNLPTPIHANNRGVIRIATAKQPTSRTHV